MLQEQIIKKGFVMFNYMQFNTCRNQEDYQDIGKAVWEYLLTWHNQTDPSTDFGSIVREILDRMKQEKSRIMIDE